VAIRDFEPLAVLLNASGVPPERITVFLNSLNADHPDGKVPMGELLGRVRALIFSETGGNGQVQLEPKTRLAVESGLTQWGFSPKEADRALSLSSTGNGEVDVQRLLKILALHRKPAAENPDGTAKVESESGKADPARRADSTGNPSPADIPKTRSKEPEALQVPATKASLASAVRDPSSNLSAGPEGTGREGTILSFKAEERKAAPVAGATGRSDGRRGVAGESSPARAGDTKTTTQASDGVTVQSEKPQNSTPPSAHRRSESGEQGVAGPDRSKGSNEGDAPRRAAKEPAAEDGRLSPETRSYTMAGPGTQQNPAKPVGVQAQPLPLSEDSVPAHVAAQVSKQISRAVLSGDPTIRLHLNPPELGMLKVQLEWSQDALKIEMVADRYQSRDLLLASVSELKEALGDQGIRVEKMDVIVNDPSGQPLSYSGREHRDPSGPGMRPQEVTGFSLSEEKGEGRPEQPLIPKEGHLLDLVA